MTDSESQQGTELEPLTINDFSAYYMSLYGRAPFQWQSRLSERACRGEWPDYVKLPTSSGKTAAIDIAVFALAYQAAVPNRPSGILTAARRIFFVVDRRIIVNEAYRRANWSVKLLRKAVDSNMQLDAVAAEHYKDLDGAQRVLLKRISGWLQYLASDQLAPPLDCFELRGGIYRDDAWVRSPLQPTVLTSTVDQVGSRMLFRGYGVSDRNLSIHAALTANDSLIILDEAHCSKPFSQTVESIARYRSERWAEQPIRTPFALVQMTATPPTGLPNDKLFELDASDYQKDGLLEQRHGCEKPVRLVLATGAKGKKVTPILAKKLAERAESLAVEFGRKKIAVVVNRVALAREVFDQLQKKYKGRVSLMIGRMRPIDRDKLTAELQREFGSGWSRRGQSAEEIEPHFVVATQCLEVGADLDFDGMVSQCASLDALRQRFGRLNRLGDVPEARGVVVAAEGDLQPQEKLNDEKPLDPIYGNALARTWHWLRRQAEEIPSDDDGSDATEIPEINFGITALDARCKTLTDEDLKQLLAPSEDAPVLMPAHVDMLCQTAPTPSPEPEVADYLHGPNRNAAEVRVCWRADLDLSLLSDWRRLEPAWLSAIEICPPSSAECLTVPLRVFRKWLRGDKAVDDTGDVLGEATGDDVDDDNRSNSERTVFVWRGKRSSQRGTDHKSRSFCASSRQSRQLRPNDTIVVPAEFGGWETFGYVPDAPPEPREPAIELHERLVSRRKDHSADGVPEASDLARIDVADEAFLQSRARSIMRVNAKLRCDDSAAKLFDELLKEVKRPEADLKGRAEELLNAIGSELADDNDTLMARLINTKGQIVRYHDGLVWITERHENRKQGMLPLPSFGDDSDTLCLTGKIPLKQHLADVYDEASRLTGKIALGESITTTVIEAARLHDVGKADPRFQAMLLNKPLSVAYMQPQLWAKSDGMGRNAAAELPDNFRHEMLSLSLLDRFKTDESIDRELLKHAVASHHGHARPFAPVCIDEAPAGLNLSEFGVDAISSKQRADWRAAHRLDSGIADRFWKMNRRYGWWGLAYVESLLRLADWFASATPGRGEAQGVSFGGSNAPSTNAAVVEEPTPLVLTGLDGSNPLAFLAALGLFRVISDGPQPHECKLAWRRHTGAWRPAIFKANQGTLTEDELLNLLDQRLESQPEKHPALRLAGLIDANRNNGETIRDFFADMAIDSSIHNRRNVDWLSCNGSDILDHDIISQLQTTRRDYHAINITGLVSETTVDHLRRSLFEAWDYSDPIAGVSLHLEPREDRRHAYQWHMPSGDPTRKIYGGMMGANRLALEAWPLFQSLPRNERLVTVGFYGTKANNTRFSWPIWSTPIPLAVLPSVLSRSDLQQTDLPNQQLVPLGIEVVFRCSRILVGKTPNLTSPVAVCP